MRLAHITDRDIVRLIMEHAPDFGEWRSSIRGMRRRFFFNDDGEIIRVVDYDAGTSADESGVTMSRTTGMNHE